MKNNTVMEIYWLRVVSCLAVVLLHSVAQVMVDYTGSESSYKVLEVLTALLMFGTPVFIFISEFLISRRYTNGVPKGFLLSRMKILLIPYAILAFLYGYLTVGELNIQMIKVSIISNIFLGSFVGYFILIIVQFYILHIVMDKFLKRYSAKFILTIGLIINLAYLAYFNFAEPLNIPLNSYIWDRGYWLPFVGWIFYFLLGYYMGKNYEEVKIKIDKYIVSIAAVGLVSMISVITVAYYDVIHLSSKRIDNILFTTCMILILIYVTSKIKELPYVVKIINNYSFSIYLIHLVFVKYLLSPLNSLNLNILVHIGLLFVISIVLSIGVSFVLNQFKWGKYLIGKPYEIKNIRGVRLKKKLAKVG